jgi:TRAP-type transport system small permease protein
MYTKLCAAISKLALQLATLGLAVIIIAVLYQVFGRYVLNDTPTWAEALAMLLVLYVTMLGCAVGVRDAGHIGLESFLVLAPEKLRLKLEVLIHALLVVFGAAMVYNGIYLAHSVWNYNIPTLGLPEGLNHVPIALCGGLMVLFSIEHIIATIKGTEVEPAWH